MGIGLGDSGVEVDFLGGRSTYIDGLNAPSFVEIEAFGLPQLGTSLFRHVSSIVVVPTLVGVSTNHLFLPSTRIIKNQVSPPTNARFRLEVKI